MLIIFCCILIILTFIFNFNQNVNLQNTKTIHYYEGEIVDYYIERKTYIHSYTNQDTEKNYINSDISNVFYSYDLHIITNNINCIIYIDKFISIYDAISYFKQFYGINQMIRINDIDICKQHV